MASGSNIYFASDFHLGVPNQKSSREREDRIVRWLESIRNDAAEIYLVGDIFDFWFEYSKAIPKGFIRFQGKLAELTDAGIKITFFKGNHDMWMFDYFTKELGIEVVSNELVIKRNGKKFYIHHGDGLGPGDFKYKFLKKIFRSSLSQWLFARIHPNFGIWLALAWSRDSRISSQKKEEYRGEEQEWLIAYCREVLKKERFDYLIFGHRHIPLDIKLSENSRYINLGEWINFSKYAMFDGNDLALKSFEETDKIK